MNLPGCTWGKSGRGFAAARVTHIFRFGRTLCCRRFLTVTTVKELEPDKLVKPSPGDCENCIRVFNALIAAPEPI